MTTNRERDTDDLIAQALYSIGHTAELLDEVAKLTLRVPRPELLGVKPHDTYPHERTLSRQTRANSQAIDKLAQVVRLLEEKLLARIEAMEEKLQD